MSNLVSVETREQSLTDWAGARPVVVVGSVYFLITDKVYLPLLLSFSSTIYTSTHWPAVNGAIHTAHRLDSKNIYLA